jgi:hypothetical protein
MDVTKSNLRKITAGPGLKDCWCNTVDRDVVVSRNVYFVYCSHMYVKSILIVRVSHYWNILTIYPLKIIV